MKPPFDPSMTVAASAWALRPLPDSSLAAQGPGGGGGHPLSDRLAAEGRLAWADLTARSPGTTFAVLLADS